MVKGRKISSEKILKKEKYQARLISYITNIGKWFLFVLPMILLIITILTLVSYPDGIPKAEQFIQQPDDYKILTLCYFIVLIIYAVNSIILLEGARQTNSSLKIRLQFERLKGRPIDSLDGFDMLYGKVKGVTYMLDVIAAVCLTSIVLFFTMFLVGELDLGFAAAGFALFGLGLALLIRSLNLNIHDVNGLQDFYKPTTHQIFLDNFFSEILSNHLDPVSYLKWDEYLAGLNQILTPAFVQKVKSQEEEELPITFAMEKILFLNYLRYQEVIDDSILTQELKEVLDVDSETFDINKGLLIEGAWHFSSKSIYKIFDYIKSYNPGFFKIIDRLQLELADNIERISKDPVYMDSCAQEVIFFNGELNIMVFLYNNSKEAKKYRIKINAPGFQPAKLTLDVKVEGRGGFDIPNTQIPLVSSDSLDIVGVESVMLENGDTIWITLEPREKGEQNFQIFLESEDGVIIEGKTRSVQVALDMKSKLKMISSIGSIIGGLAVPLIRIMPNILPNILPG
ncbi:MAG: hypothetical protein ACFFAS_02885 [Promethearchaeota archaeon]